MNELKFAFRQLVKNSGFTAVAVLTLALVCWESNLIWRGVKIAVEGDL